MPFTYELIVIVLMLTINALFAAYEMALASLPPHRMAALLSEKKKGATEAVFMKNRMEASLAIIQLGITLVGALAAATGGLGVEDTVVPYLQTTWGLSLFLAKIISLLVLVLPLTFFTIIFAELVPKMLALNNAEWVVLRMSPAMKILAAIAYPIISVIEAIVKKLVGLFSPAPREPHDAKAHGMHELKTAVFLGRTSKLLGAREEKIVLAAAQLTSRPVKDIIIPAGDIFMINLENSLTDAFLHAHLDMHTRFPVCSVENDPQTIQGYVNFKDIVVALKINPTDPSIKGILRPILRVEENFSLSQVLERMMQEKTHISIVISRTGTIVGMATMEDIIEELVGEIEDEFDRSSLRLQPYGASWIIGGGVTMQKVVTTLGLDRTKRPVGENMLTLEGWCAQKIGKKEISGEIIESDGIRVIPRKFRRKKMAEAIVSTIETAKNK